MEEQTKDGASFRKRIVWGLVAAIMILIVWSAFSSSHEKDSIEPNDDSAPVASSDVTDSSDFIANRLSHMTLDLNNADTWKPNSSDLPLLMQVFGMAPADPPKLHHHQHLDIFVNGKSVPVPHNIGLSRQAEVPIHTHGSEGDGIIHVETTDVNLNPTLGVFFDVWGVSFTQTNIGGYVTDETHPLAVFVDGSKYEGDPRQVPLDQHYEILVVYGQDIPNPIPSSFNFPDGL